MTIRSIDMQVLVQKVGEVAKIQQAEKTSQHIKQQSFLEQIAQQTEVVSKTVNEASASESGLIREKQSEKKKKHTGNQLISPKVVILNNPALVSNIQYQAYFSLTSI
jgi:hypothetical protein